MAFKSKDKKTSVVLENKSATKFGDVRDLIDPKFELRKFHAKTPLMNGLNYLQRSLKTYQQQFYNRVLWRID